MHRIIKLGAVFFLLCHAFLLSHQLARAEPGLGEIRWVAFNFAPRGWAKCDGQLLAISQNQALFALLGTIYGGDGRTTLALPDVRGRSTIHEGQGLGLSNRPLGSRAGNENASVNFNQLANHSHLMTAHNMVGSSNLPNDRVVSNVGRLRLYSDQVADTSLSAAALTATGQGQSHNNMSPYIGLTCIIALQGLFPSRN